MDFLNQKEREVLYYKEKRKYSDEETAKELKISVSEAVKLHTMATVKVIAATGMTPAEIVKISPF